jgi:phage-related minor tail protein
MKTISEAIEELHSNLKDSAKIIATEFNKKCHEVADKLSIKLDELSKYAEDSKDQSLGALKEQYENLKETMKDYQKVGDDKAEEYRKNLVEKLDDLSKKIEQYNNKHKH